MGLTRMKRLCKRCLHITMVARIEMSLKDSAREDEDTPSSKNWKWITLEEFVLLQRRLLCKIQTRRDR